MRTARAALVPVLIAAAAPSARAAGDCADPGRLIGAALDVVNHPPAPLSVQIPRLFPTGVRLDAVQSPSAQPSTHKADPRLLVKVGCTFFTFTLAGRSLELGVTGQRADVRLPADDQDNPRELTDDALAALAGPIKPDEDGEILVNLAYADRGGFDAPAVVSHFDRTARRNDSNLCSGCHLDIETLQLGQKVVTVGAERFLALVNPLSGEGTGGYCVPQDLEFIQRCKCDAKSQERCEVLGSRALSAEACARLRAILALRPTQLGTWRPERCLSGDTLPI